MTQELLAGVHPDHLDVQPAGEHRHHRIAFVQAQQAVIDKDAGQLIADSAVDQGRSHRRINAAGQAEDHLFVADLLADLGDRLG